jgi:hypothetical protein
VMRSLSAVDYFQGVHFASQLAAQFICKYLWEPAAWERCWLSYWACG